MTEFAMLPDARSLFDETRPPSRELMDDCVHCGFCLAACPTYMLWREEMDSPRGRIYLMRMAAEGKIAALDHKVIEHFDRCLGCMSCMTACPSGVEYDKLIEATRAQIERLHKRSLWDRLHRELIFQIFPHPKRLKFLVAPLRLYQALGLPTLLERSRILRLLPARVVAMHSLLPDLGPRASAFPDHIPPAGFARKRVGLLLGCVQRVFFQQVNAATVRVLAGAGCELFIPPLQGCCGALATHVGREEDSLTAARKLIDAFGGLDLDYIAINAAGCGSNLKSYGHLLRDDPAYRDRAQQFASKCRDVSEILAELSPLPIKRTLKVRAAYHDSCHLLHAQGIRTQPRTLLKSIPGVELIDVPESNICCGSAGVFNLLQPETAQTLGARKANSVIKTNAEALISGNPGCLLQISKELRKKGKTIPTYHYVEILDAAMRTDDGSESDPRETGKMQSRRQFSISS